VHLPWLDHLVGQVEDQNDPSAGSTAPRGRQQQEFEKTLCPNLQSHETIVLGPDSSFCLDFEITQDFNGKYQKSILDFEQ
jgi:hypothetical protein